MIAFYITEKFELKLFVGNSVGSIKMLNHNRATLFPT